MILETTAASSRWLLSCPGSSARHNGQSATFTALNGLSQQLLIQAALDEAATSPSNVVEAHGTGTALGDPIEVSSISAVLSKRGPVSCSLCGVKGNVGHTEGTAGVANVIRVAGLLGLEEAAVSAQLRILNPQVGQVRTESLHPSVDANVRDGRRKIQGGASSFGWSGIIAHGVLQLADSDHAWSSHDTRCRSLYRTRVVCARRSLLKNTLPQQALLGAMLQNQSNTAKHLA